MNGAWVRGQLPGNRIPANRFDPVGVKIQPLPQPYTRFEHVQKLPVLLLLEWNVLFIALARILFGAAFTITAAYSLGRVCLWQLRTPKAMALPVGAAILSVSVFTLLLLGVAGVTSFLTLGICVLLPSLWRDKRTPHVETREPIDRVTAWVLAGIFSAYGVLYLVHALAPELQPDAVSYHLGLVVEYFRLGTFPERIDFYGILPQGMEMLYLFAFAFGKHSAAKLVHFAFLISTIPVLLAVGRRLGIRDSVSWVAAAMYFCAPVVGISGTSAYTDAALVCCTLATFYFLIAWKQEADPKYLVPAGLLAGFCYAIKLNALLIVALALLFVLVECRRKPKLALARSGLLAAAAAVIAAPWMLRSVILTGNPLAPLFNTWFPNPYFLPIVEKTLAKFFRTYEGFTFRNAPWELTMGGASHGIAGPLFLALPVGLLALRCKSGRWVWLAGGALAVPWFFNVGTRFLMPSLPFFALALAMALGRRALWAALIFHAVVCWPGIIARYERPGLWRLRGFPWHAALRLQSDHDYLRIALGDYNVAGMVNRQTRRQGTILGLTALPSAYIDREIIQYWQSALGVRARETLLEAAYTQDRQLYDWISTWIPQRLRSIRLRLLGPHPFEWEIHEASILLGGNYVNTAANWQAAAWPNLFETPFAFDGNQASRWRSWEPARTGMFVEIDLGQPQLVSGLALSSHWGTSQMEILGKGLDGKWRLLSSDLKAEARPPEDLMRAAVQHLKKSGIDYIVTAVEGADAGVWLGKNLHDHAAEYGITEIERYEAICLYKL